MRAILGVVKRGPAAVVVLHRQQPDRCRARRPLRAALPPTAFQRHRSHGRIVHVGIMRVFKFEKPARRLDAGAVLLPVGAYPAFFAQQPLRRPFAAFSRVRSIPPRPGRAAPGRCPTPAKSRAECESSSPSRMKKSAGAFGRDHARMIVGVTQNPEHDQDVDHRREDRASPSEPSR